MRARLLAMVVLGVLAWEAGSRVDAGSGDVRMYVKVRDLVVGEFSVMDGSPVTLVISNHGPDAVRLPTGASSDWMARSPYWAIHVDGPVDSRCDEYQAVVRGLPPVGVQPHVLIPSGEEKEFGLPGLGIGEQGQYRLQVEYRGGRAEGGFLQEPLVTEEVVLRIAPPTKTEEEVVRRWREENPDTPWCLFPAGMGSNFTDTAGFVERYPTSIYAGWALWRRLKSHLGGFTGPPSAAEPTAYLEAIKRPELQVAYPEPLRDQSKGHERVLTGGAAAGWRRDAIKVFLNAHPEFPYAAEMRLRIAMDYLALGQYTAAAAELKEVSKLEPQTSASKRAGDYLASMEARKMLP